jgi:hypothetical protein
VHTPPCQIHAIRIQCYLTGRGVYLRTPLPVRYAVHTQCVTSQGGISPSTSTHTSGVAQSSLASLCPPPLSMPSSTCRQTISAHILMSTYELRQSTPSHAKRSRDGNHRIISEMTIIGSSLVFSELIRVTQAIARVYGETRHKLCLAHVSGSPVGQPSLREGAEGVARRVGKRTSRWHAPVASTGGGSM